MIKKFTTAFLLICLFMQYTPIFYKTLDASSDPNMRIIINYGGSSSSKTISTLQLLTLKAFKYPGLRFTLVGESMPIIKKTILADWRDIVMRGYFQRSRFNKTELTYRFPSGSIFSFVNADDESRFQGPRQDYLLIDEASNIKQRVFDQAEIRTDKQVFITFNPTNVFWAKELFDWEDAHVIHSTYNDNPFVSERVIKSLIRRELTDPNFYNVYTLGNWGSLEGLIFKEGVNWYLCDGMPKVAKQKISGLDFGFSVDPAALVDVYYSDGQLWIQERVYQKELLNSQISKHIHQLTVADSAEPKSIRELQVLGCKVIGAEKGPDSITNGINLIKEFRVNVSKSSINLIKELRSYQWAKNRAGEQLDKPVDEDNHAIDAMRYAISFLFHGRREFTLI